MFPWRICRIILYRNFITASYAEADCEYDEYNWEFHFITNRFLQTTRNYLIVKLIYFVFLWCFFISNQTSYFPINHFIHPDRVDLLFFSKCLKFSKKFERELMVFVLLRCLHILKHIFVAFKLFLLKKVQSFYLLKINFAKSNAVHIFLSKKIIKRITTWTTKSSILFKCSSKILTRTSHISRGTTIAATISTTWIMWRSLYKGHEELKDNYKF